jgi:hypothetical protein
MSLQKPDKKNTTNGVSCDIVNRLYQGIRYFQNATQLQSMQINVISFTATRKVQPFLHQIL